VQHLEIEAELFFQSAATGGHLWADGDERAAGIRDVTRDLLQSFQLCDTVWSPSTTKPGQYDGTRGAQFAKADVAVTAGQVELGRGLADADCPLSLARGNQVIFVGVKDRNYFGGGFIRLEVLSYRVEFGLQSHQFSLFQCSECVPFDGARLLSEFRFRF
jgi:hypothetical protein